MSPPAEHTPAPRAVQGDAGRPLYVGLFIQLFLNNFKIHLLFKIIFFGI
jgi:hypothetical protein